MPDNHIIILTNLLRIYHKFIFYDSIISIIDARNFGHISVLFRNLADVLLNTLNNITFDETITKEYINRTNQIINKITDEYSGNKEIHNDLKDSFQHFFKDKALNENDIIFLLKQNDFIVSFQNFIIAYGLLSKYAKGILSDLLTEFHNAMSHTIAALLHAQISNYDVKNHIFVRNMDKACGHLKRGAKDTYKIIIKCIYSIIQTNSKLLKEFKYKFIKIRCDEIDSLSDIQKHQKIELNIKNLALEYLDKLHIEQNKENKKIFRRNHKNTETFKDNLQKFYLYKERI